MKEFCYLDYCTEYSCKGSIKSPMEKHACFGGVFNNIRNGMHNIYTIILHCDLVYPAKYHKSNFCLLDIARVKKHLRLLKSLFPIKFRVINLNPSTIKVILEISGVKAACHKYALTWLRYTYEYPYNVLLKDAYELKNDPTFRFESIANLFNLCLGSFCEYTRPVHQTLDDWGVPERISLKLLKERIEGIDELNEIYQKIRKKSMIPDTINGFSANDIEYWETGFEERKKVYLSNYKK